MQYYSTNKKALPATLEEAVVHRIKACLCLGLLNGCLRIFTII